MENEELKNFWKETHLRNENLFLAASSGSYQVAQLKIGNLIKPSDKILNIGVGRGYCTKYWYDYGCKVSVLDITPEAIDKVKDFIEASFLDSNLHELPENTFDYALSLLVIQHMSLSTLKRHMHYVIKSLKPTGTFMFQFAYATDGHNHDESFETFKNGSMRTSHDEMLKIVSDNNGVLINSFDGGKYPQWNMGWHIFHIKRK